MPPVSDQAYKNLLNINHSAMRVFNTCPNLYREQFITKVYEEPDKDYFLYGSLVDCLLTEPDKLKEHFVRVDSKLDPLDALKYEQKIKELELEMNTPDKKGETMIEKAARENKTALSGVESRKTKIQELHVKCAAIKQLGTKEQVTNAVWQNAEETAEAIKNNPMFRELTFNEFTSQQVFVDSEAGRKGRLDYVRFSPPIQTLYASYSANLIDIETLRSGINDLDEKSKYGTIVDVKTTYLISKFEPEQYASQLAVYQHLVFATTGIKCRCFIIAGDKDTNCKRSQDYELSQPLLDRAWNRYLQVEGTFLKCQKANVWPSAKELWGTQQECFRCSICKDRPFSFNEPLLVNGPLFLR